jgi:hypothetical protein
MSLIRTKRREVKEAGKYGGGGDGANDHNLEARLRRRFGSAE